MLAQYLHVIHESRDNSSPRETCLLRRLNHPPRRVPRRRQLHFPGLIMSSVGNQNDPYAAPATTDLLKSAKFAKSGAAPDAAPVNTADLLTAAYDPSKLHPLAGLGDQVDYLMLEDDKLAEMPGSDTAIPSRGWSDDLCYGTGTMYLGGTSIPSLLYLHVHFSSVPAPLARLPTLPYLSHLIVLHAHHMPLRLCTHRFGHWRALGFPRGRPSPTRRL
jgi:hypothetical protein